ncbi:MAG: manganese efflux pump [Elusimicrobiaceae bacterium]|nr:manganese efflux pump [Elusimicrobiaceae bacterium]
MNICVSFLIALSLSMDNLAVTVSAGCSRQLVGHRRTVWQISFLFALAHFVMFSIGYEGGILLHAGRLIGGWIAGIILCFIGGKMIHSAYREAPSVHDKILSSLYTQLLLAVDTSVDALLVGAGLALSLASFWQTNLFLVICVFGTSLCGFYLGRYLGQKFGRAVEVAGGLVLVGFGAKMLLEATGIC